VLLPGESADHKYGVMCYTGVLEKAPGLYTAVAHYRDRNRRPPPAPTEASPFTAEVTSNRVRFYVRGCARRSGCIKTKADGPE
jgi:hypothetical protein